MSTVLVKVRNRSDTAVNWTAADPILSVGEGGFETDTGKLKIGDGITAWTSLAYIDSSFEITVSQVTGLQAQLTGYDNHVADSTIHFTQAAINIATSQVTGLQTQLTGYDNHVADSAIHFTQAAITIAISQVTSLQTSLDAKEDFLGNPTVDGYLLSSTVAGVRSWIPAPAGGGIGGSIANDQVAVGSGTDISGTGGLTFNDNQLTIISVGGNRPLEITTDSASPFGEIIFKGPNCVNGVQIAQEPSASGGDFFLWNLESGGDIRFGPGNSLAAWLEAGTGNLRLQNYISQYNGLTNYSQGDILEWSSTNSRFEVVTPSGGGGGSPDDAIVFAIALG